jgi:hypothetical protein
MKLFASPSSANHVTCTFLTKLEFYNDKKDITKQLFMLLKPCWRFKTESKFKYLVKVQE